MKKLPCFALLFVIFFCGLGLATEADDIRIKAEVDKAFLTIGDLVTYTVTVEHAPDIRILSSIPAPASDILEIKKVEDIHKKLKKKIVTGRKFVLTTFRLGEFVLDPVTIEYRREGHPVKSLQTNKLYLTVKSVAEGDAKEDIRDVKSVIPLKFRMGKFLWTLVALMALALGYFIFRALRKHKSLDQPAAPPLTSEEEAFLRLTELFESDLLKRAFVKLYYLRLSEILRIYFEKRYKILAVESTTVEILRAIRPLRLDAGLYQKIQYVLESSDLAKFAKWIPTPVETIQLNKKAEEIVRESTPVPEPPPAVEASHGV
jgi:hypothetical protein